MIKRIQIGHLLVEVATDHGGPTNERAIFFGGQAVCQGGAEEVFNRERLSELIVFLGQVMDEMTSEE